MTLKDHLTQFGLNEKEAQVYLASLELGPASVQEIAKHAAIKRPTAYNVLGGLETHGLIKKTRLHKKLAYIAEEPTTLIRILKNRQETIAEALPELAIIMATTKTRPKISIYEGPEEIRRAYEEVYASTEIWWFGSIKNINQQFADQIAQFTKTAKKYKPRVREIITSDPMDLAYAAELVSEHHEFRVMPPGFDYKIDAAIYGNKIAIFAVTRDLFTVVIESEEVATSFRSLYELAWRSAETLR